MALNTFIKILISFMKKMNRILFFSLYTEEKQTNGKNQEHLFQYRLCSHKDTTI